MDLIAQLRVAADAYCRLSGLSKARVATLAVNDGKLFDRLDAGKTVTVATYETVMGWLSDHWPRDAAWPDGVPRPPRREIAA